MVTRNRCVCLCDTVENLCRVLEGLGVEGTEINIAEGESAQRGVRRGYVRL